MGVGELGDHLGGGLFGGGPRADGRPGGVGGGFQQAKQVGAGVRLEASRGAQLFVQGCGEGFADVLQGVLGGGEAGLLRLGLRVGLVVGRIGFLQRALGFLELPLKIAQGSVQ